MSALDEKKTASAAKLRAAQRQFDREAAARARAERKPTLLDDLVNALPDLGEMVPDLGFGGEEAPAGERPMTYDEIMRAGPAPKVQSASEELDDDEDDSDSGDELFMELEHRNRLKAEHAKEIARLDASAMTYEEALAAAQMAAVERTAGQTRQIGSPVAAVRSRAGTEDNLGPVCLVPTIANPDDGDDFGDDGDDDDADGHYLRASSPHEEKDWQINKLPKLQAGRISPVDNPPPGSVLPPSVFKKDELVVTTADGQTVALEQLDERLYQPAPAP